MEADDVINDIGWKVDGDYEPPIPFIKPFFPRLKHAFQMIPTAIRLVMHTFYEWWHGRDAFINIFRVLRHFKYTGVPIGGIGCGTIGTDYRGGFGRFSLIPGIKEQWCENVNANQFIVTVQSVNDGNVIYQSVLGCGEDSLKNWRKMPENCIKYRGLFPRAWRLFKLGDTNIKIICEQLSPVIPNNYKDSSLPTANFKFKIINNSNNDVNVSITFVIRNGTGNPKWDDESICNIQSFESGITLNHTISNMPLTYAITTEKSSDNLVYSGSFNPRDDGQDVLDNIREKSFKVKDFGSQAGIALFNQIRVSKNSNNLSILFNLTWHMPVVHFGSNGRQYKRRYTRFFNGPDANMTAMEISKYSLANNSHWIELIENWQNPILNDDTLPIWYRSALFNELYFITDGSTTWFEFDEEWKESEQHLSEATIAHFKEYGRFGYMESWEYFMINTYDVNFYSSWAILKNWPQIEMSIQLEFADQICRTDDSNATSLVEGKRMKIKKFARVPHDIGHPKGEPWININAYLLHDTSDWKDLNLKFVINCWRDHQLIETKNKKLILDHFYSKCELIVQRALEEWDIDNDGMIENSGMADQTYDVWTMTGSSAYCGSLWIGSLAIIRQMSKELGYNDKQEEYSNILQKAIKSYMTKLWNGKFFLFDEEESNKGVIMADQLCGLWALKMIGGISIDFDDKKIVSSLEMVFKHNVMSYENGESGAVNGYMTSGGVDDSSIQSEEVWTGITYAVASFMIEMGMIDEGFKTAEGLFNRVWNTYPLQYQSPEAITNWHMYRAIGYMRPLSIWSMQHSIENRK